MLSDGVSQSEIAKIGNVDKMYVHRILKGTRTTNLRKFLNFVENIGGRVVFDDNIPPETSKSVHFVKPKIISAKEGLEGPIDENYLAVPLASMPVAAGPGIIPEESIKSWVLVWTGQEAIRHRSNLAAIEIGRGQLSMEPTLHPGDLVLIDRNDTLPQDPPGNIYLVQSPDDDGLAIKRVRLQRKNDQELVVFFSDNMDYLPEIFDLNADYEGDLRRAIKGRVVWSWSDMTKK